MVKRRLIDVGLGVLLFLLLLIAEFLVTLPSGTPADGARLRAGLNHELSLTAAPALVLSVLLAIGSHTRSSAQGLWRGLTWVVVVGLVYLAIGLGNGTTVMFATTGMWLTLAAVVVGSVIGGWVGGRRTPQASGEKESAPWRTRLT
ncbi:MAG TPA: hypothetical protein VHO26_06330 [Propionibacteriaceae bacterium]|nr:hypothetical protein [Propionibacteriaceae bacterium]